MIPTPIYERHRDGNARVCIDGRQHDLGSYGSPESRQTYRELVDAWSRELRTVSYVRDNLLPAGNNGKPPSRVTISRWVTKGVFGEKLKVVRVGAKVFLSADMVRDFLTRVTAAQDCQQSDQHDNEVDVPTDVELAEAGLA
ncbi:DUF1580 domain-containing protein [Fuerstiella marisgermanici]|uniref:Uncharacterized protein n=1 Tax=Fuerstiella marisgermanici TaxID=1891926 RepID=A0A1P8WKP4_9PLAN|nr:DUF1580 domain-containing protein [Fuerstiella marisgermanici]APZ94613.1 hypothetical protein Fuma_04246 [Fuerstiella marisgermanici]